MISHYIQAVTAALGGLLDLIARLALPLALCFAAVVAAVTVFALRRGGAAALPAESWRRGRSVAGAAAGYALVAVLVVAVWGALRMAHPVARQALQREESAEATANASNDAPSVYQYGPAVGALAERTYTRTLTLPPYLVQRIGTDGVGVLAPYLSDPSAENVLRLVDTFRRSGTDVVFTREVTRLDEEPIPFDDSQIKTRFKRLPGRAYDLEFEGRYVWSNATASAVNARFTFPLPQAGTVRDISIAVGSDTVSEPGEGGVYEWKGAVPPGEKREAVVRYRVAGARTWHYDLGSQRRRVQRFRLEADPGGPVRFPRGSLQPTSGSGDGRDALRWELGNVVTAQQVALAFPPDVAARDGFLQALTALPAAFAAFLVGAVAVSLRRREPLSPGRLALALTVVALGLGAAPVLAEYVGAAGGLFAGPLAGAFLAAGMLGLRRSPSALSVLVAAALLPAAFLSARHSGLLVLVLVAGGLAALTAVGPRVGTAAVDEGKTDDL